MFNTWTDSRICIWLINTHKLRIHDRKGNLWKLIKNLEPLQTIIQQNICLPPLPDPHSSNPPLQVPSLALVYSLSFLRESVHIKHIRISFSLDTDGSLVNTLASILLFFSSCKNTSWQLFLVSLYWCVSFILSRGKQCSEVVWSIDSGAKLISNLIFATY